MEPDRRNWQPAPLVSNEYLLYFGDQLFLNIMIKRHNNISLMLGVPGVLLQIVGNVMYRTAESSALFWIGLPIAIVGTALLIGGLCYYAMSKGRHPAWGILGLFSCFGLIVLALLQDRQPAG